MVKNTYGLDLGSYEIKVYDKKKDTIWKEKNVIAIRDQREIFAVGDTAYEMYQKAPANIEVIFPMKGGVISRFNNMQFLLQNLLKEGRQFVRGAEYVIAVPTDVTEVEKKAFFDLVIHSTARAKEVNIVERSIADAIGLGLDVTETKGMVIVNFGGETTELSVIAGGGLVLNRLLKTGGTLYDESIVTLVRHSHDFLIGRQTAEVLRSYTLVRAALRDPLLDCVRAIHSMIDRTPPEVRNAIHKNGIFLTGGMAAMPGLDTYIKKATGLPVAVAKDPDVCAVHGLEKIINSKELRKLAFSMLDDNYRWMR